MMEHRGKELGKHAFHVAGSSEAENAVEERNVSTARCHHDGHMLTLAGLG